MLMSQNHFFITTKALIIRAIKSKISCLNTYFLVKLNRSYNF